MSSQVDDRTRLSHGPTQILGISIGQRILAGGGVLGALAASSCCLMPLALFGIGVGGAWAGYLTRLAPYQPYFLGFAAICLGLGFWLRHRSKQIACAGDAGCARPLPTRFVTIGFVVAGVLIVAVIALDVLAPYLV